MQRSPGKVEARAAPVVAPEFDGALSRVQRANALMGRAVILRCDDREASWNWIEFAALLYITVATPAFIGDRERRALA